MNRISTCLAAGMLLMLASATSAQSRVPEFRQVNKFVLGGEGGWDYITYDPEGSRLFVAHNDQILVVNARSGKQTGAMAAHGAHGIALVPEFHRGFFTNGGAGTVTAFDLQTLKPLREIKAGENPDAILYDKFSKRVIVMTGGSKELLAIDPNQMKIIASVPLGGKLEYAAADENRIYVNVQSTSEIAAVDSQSWKPVQRWKLPDCVAPTGLAIDLSTRHLFSVCENARMIVMDASSGAVVATLPTGERTDGAAFDPALKLAFASNGQGTLTVVQQNNGRYEVAENVHTERGARTLAIDLSSHTLYLPTTTRPGGFCILVFAPKP